MGMTVSTYARDVKTHLRITVWPGGPIPLPPVPGAASHLDAPRGVILPNTVNVVGTRDVFRVGDLVPNGETYLRLFELDLDDADAIITFVNRHGILGGAWAFRDLEDLPYFKNQLELEQEWSVVTQALAAELPGRGNSQLARAMTNPDFRFIQTLTELRIRPTRRLETLVASTQFMETLVEFRFAARCLRDLTWAYRVLRHGVLPEDVPWSSASPDYPITTIGDATRLLTEVFPRLLRRFAPQVDVWSGPDHGLLPWEGPVETTITASRGPGRALLYQVCALELYNHIAEGAEYRLCANETCERLFVRQEGRAEAGHYRTQGVRYCTASCARAQAQRQYRRRRR
jgi:hypothetical protein